ncbi:MAG: EamA family transporter [Pyrinomonadaceae bacterium]
MRKTEITKSNANRNTILLIAALAAVYIIWGSTYLAIKYAIETLPTFLMAGTRFLAAGAVLFAVGRFSKDYEKPKLIYWRTSFIVGALLLLGGNGLVVLAEHYISSGLAALLIATEPFWIVLISWLMMKKSRPNWRVALGLLIGFVGVLLLIGANGFSSENGNGQLIGTVLIIAATLAWASGSLYGLSAPAPKSALLTAGMQMLSGGFLLLLVGTLTGEWTQFNIAEVSSNSWIALAYLTVFGSIIGFTAYSWLLKNVEPSIASTYAYVNPVIAVILGWAIAGESLTGQMLVGAGIIVGSVVLITSQGKSESEKIHESNTPTRNCKTLSVSA